MTGRRTHMDRGEPARVPVASATRRERMELSQLRVLCIGIAGAIAADALILIYFRVI